MNPYDEIESESKATISLHSDALQPIWTHFAEHIGLSSVKKHVIKVIWAAVIYAQFMQLMYLLYFMDTYKDRACSFCSFECI